MPELRQDPILGHWVVVAEERAKRPNQFASVLSTPSPTSCPFCVGHEDETPPPILSLPNEIDWRVRVVSNKYPALEMTATTATSPAQPGFGAHEVIIESADHITRTAELSIDQLTDVLTVYRDRLAERKMDSRLAYGLIFKNVGPAAGASIEHLHSQLLATPMVPDVVQRELDGAERFFAQHDRCVFCDLLERETDDAVRVVETTERFAAICPYAGRFPYETWIVPYKHASHYEESVTDEDLQQLAGLLRNVSIRLDHVLNQPDCNYVLHTAPFDTNALAHYHWHIEIIPRVTTIAGFELGSGYFVNSTSPEHAAADLRETTC
jgi:UDPglucose--hexose-1-phosphate uridylyltransferase